MQQPLCICHGRCQYGGGGSGSDDVGGRTWLLQLVLQSCIQ